MASFDLRIEDSSPLISYAPSDAWTDSSANDPSATSYSGGSYHTTNARGATATISFNGTGISVFGGRRQNYGAFSMSIDGVTITNGDSNSPAPSVKQLLGSASGLTNGPHTSVITSTGGGPIDIDWVDIQIQVGSASAKLSTEIIDDSDPRISYLPSDSDWSTNNEPSFMNNTLHFTQTLGASASLSFSGDAVAVYGTMSPDHANIRVTIDGRSSVFTGGSNGLVSGLRSQVLLYYANDLGPEQHTLTIHPDVQANTGPFADIDAITVYSAIPDPSVSDPTPTGPKSNNSGLGPGLSSVSKPVIIGAVIGGVIGLFLLIAIIFYFIRRNRNRAPRIDEPDTYLPATPALPMQKGNMMETGFSNAFPIVRKGNPLPPLPPARTASKDSIARHSIAPSYYSDPSYTSDGPSRTSSIRSSTILVPKLNPAPHRTSPGILGSGITAVSNIPRRPSRRPPPLNV